LPPGRDRARPGVPGRAGVGQGDGTSTVDNAKVSLWNAATGERKAILERATNGGLRTAFHPAGTLLASNGWETQLRLWDPVLGRLILSLTSDGYPEFSRDGRIFVQRGNEVDPWQVDPALEYRTLAHDSGLKLNYARPSIHRDGRILAVGTDRGVVLWDLARGMELAFLSIGMAWHSMFDLSGDLLTNGSAGVLRWPIDVDPARGELRIGPPRQLPLPGTDCGIPEDRTGQIVAVAQYWREVRRIEGGFCGFSPDRRLAVLLNSGKVVCLVEIETGRSLARLESPDQYAVGDAAFSHDGSRLVVTTNEPPCAHVWDLRAIRKQLSEIGLDWDAPTYSEDDAASPDLPPLPPLKVDYGPHAGHVEHFSERPEHLVEK